MVLWQTQKPMFGQLLVQLNQIKFILNLLMIIHSLNGMLLFQQSSISNLII